MILGWSQVSRSTHTYKPSGFEYISTSFFPSSLNMVDMMELPSGSECDPSRLEREPAFKAWKLNSTTFIIKEHKDSYDERPLIYAKMMPGGNTIVIVDTGCGGATEDPTINIKSLRVFIETVPIPDNDHEPINEGGRMKYTVILTHCHYDHICTSIFLSKLH